MINKGDIDFKLLDFGGIKEDKKDVYGDMFVYWSIDKLKVKGATTFSIDDKDNFSIRICLDGNEDMFSDEDKEMLKQEMLYFIQHTEFRYKEE
jgi:hypothetical protein